MCNKIAVINSNIGNISSVINMLLHIGADAYSVSDPNKLKDYEKIILPGVGSFDAAVLKLQSNGMYGSIKSAANNGVPILGICLGMQLLLNESEEGKERGLGLIDGIVKKIIPNNASIKVPHMGWNAVTPTVDSRIFCVNDSLRFYFAHSYHCECNQENIIAITSHGIDFSSAIIKENIFGVQFHPEKSHEYGMNLLRKFSRL